MSGIGRMGSTVDVTAGQHPTTNGTLDAKCIERDLICNMMAEEDMRAGSLFGEAMGAMG